jgi:hypothetical protein
VIQVFDAPRGALERAQKNWTQLRGTKYSGAHAGLVGAILLLFLFIPRAVEAHGEQVIAILGADLALCLGFVVTSVLWKARARNKVFLLAILLVGIAVTHMAPFFPQTVGETAQYSMPALFLLFGFPPLVLCGGAYALMTYWGKRK